MANKKDIEEEFRSSIPYQIVKNSSKNEGRMFIICILLICVIVIQGIYIVYLLNDIGSYETVETVDMDTENGDNNYKSIGGDNYGTYESN